MFSSPYFMLGIWILDWLSARCRTAFLLTLALQSLTTRQLEAEEESSSPM
jgi:hypothetical protein